MEPVKMALVTGQNSSHALKPRQIFFYVPAGDKQKFSQSLQAIFELGGITKHLGGSTGVLDEILQYYNNNVTFVTLSLFHS